VALPLGFGLSFIFLGVTALCGLVGGWILLGPPSHRSDGPVTPLESLRLQTAGIVFICLGGLGALSPLLPVIILMPVDFPLVAAFLFISVVLAWTVFLFVGFKTFIEATIDPENPSDSSGEPNPGAMRRLASILRQHCEGTWMRAIEQEYGSIVEELERLKTALESGQPLSPNLIAEHLDAIVHIVMMGTNSWGDVRGALGPKARLAKAVDRVDELRFPDDASAVLENAPTSAL
jgi:hypothetical protein